MLKTLHQIILTLYTLYIYTHIYIYINIYIILTKMNKTHKILCSLILDLMTLAMEFNCFTKSLFYSLTSSSE